MKTTSFGFPAITKLTAAAVGICASALSMSVQATDSAPATTVVLKAAHVFDSTGTSLRDGATVVVTGDKIVSVGNGPIPAGAKVIDLGDATILPGFIDAHVHLTDELQDNYYKGFYNSMFRFPGEQAHYAELYAIR
jgi:hypothetical protein